MSRSVLPACTYVYHIHAWHPQRSEETVRSTGTGVTGYCEIPFGCWDPNVAPLQEQLVFLTAEPPLCFPCIQFGLVMWRHERGDMKRGAKTEVPCERPVAGSSVVA